MNRQIYNYLPSFLYGTDGDSINPNPTVPITYTMRPYRGKEVPMRQFLVDGKPQWMWRATNGTWHPESGPDFEGTPNRLEEVTVVPGKRVGRTNLNKASDDYYRQLGQAEMQQTVGDIDKVMLGTLGLGTAGVTLPELYAGGLAAGANPYVQQMMYGMADGMAADTATKIGSGKTFGEWGQQYLSPYLSKYMSRPYADFLSDMVGEAVNPGYYTGGYFTNKYLPRMTASVSRGLNRMRNDYSIGLPNRSYTRIVNPEEIKFIDENGVLRWKDPHPENPDSDKDAYRRLYFTENGIFGNGRGVWKPSAKRPMITEKPGSKVRFEEHEVQNVDPNSNLREVYPVTDVGGHPVTGVSRAEDFEYWTPNRYFPWLYKRSDFARTSALRPNDDLKLRTSPFGIEEGDFPTNSAYRITDINEAKDIAESGKVRALPKDKVVEGGKREFKSASGKRFSFGKALGNSHGGKSFAKGQPWKGTTSGGSAQRVILAYPGEDITWRVGHHGSYSPETQWSEINHGAGLWKQFDASRNTPLDASKILPYTQTQIDDLWHPVLLF